MNFYYPSPSKLLGALMCILLISGCATKPSLYAWGSYEEQVYARFKATSSPEQQIQAMEKDLQTQVGNQPLPPGFHAHLGLLYGEAGRSGDMREQFLLEKQYFPESTKFMDFLLAKMDKAQGAKP